MFANVYEKRKFNGLLPICREIRPVVAVRRRHARAAVVRKI